LGHPNELNLKITKMSKIKIKQEKSGIHTTVRQKRTLVALGFSKLNQTLEVEATPQIKGMLEKVKHLVAVVG
jgi:large subunit ribosomal protein L30